MHVSRENLKPMKENSYQHWQLQRDQDQILWLTINRSDASVNSLNREVFAELDVILEDIHRNLPSGVIILSGKPKGFIAGADIKQFIEIANSDEAFQPVPSGPNYLDG